MKEVNLLDTVCEVLGKFLAQMALIKLQLSFLHSFSARFLGNHFQTKLSTDSVLTVRALRNMYFKTVVSKF